MKRTLTLLLAALLCSAGRAPAEEPIAAPISVPTWTDACQTPAHDSAAPCSPQFWGSAEYLLWWIKKAPVQTPLVTSATPDSVTSGAIGERGTQILIGGQDYDFNTRQGGRFTLGGWLTQDQMFGLEGSYFFLTQKTITRTAGGDGSAGSPIIGLPTFDPSIGLETFAPFNLPGSLAGTHILTLKDNLQGGEANALAKVFCNDWLNLHVLGGFRYLNFRESLSLASTSTGVPGGVNAGVSFSSFDEFKTQNNFYGGQLGLGGEAKFGGIFVNGTAKIALGSMNESVDIGGNSTLASAGVLPAPVNQPAGFFALGSNSGHFTQDKFAVVPEGDVNVGYQFGANTRVFVGYTFLYMSDEARPGSQIDHSVNSTQSPFLLGTPATLIGEARPTFIFQHSDFWAQGINFGLQYSF